MSEVSSKIKESTNQSKIDSELPFGKDREKENFNWSKKLRSSLHILYFYGTVQSARNWFWF